MEVPPPPPIQVSSILIWPLAKPAQRLEAHFCALLQSIFSSPLHLHGEAHAESGAITQVFIIPTL